MGFYISPSSKRKTFVSFFYTNGEKKVKLLSIIDIEKVSVHTLLLSSSLPSTNEKSLCTCSTPLLFIDMENPYLLLSPLISILSIASVPSHFWCEVFLIFNITVLLPWTRQSKVGLELEVVFDLVSEVERCIRLEEEYLPLLVP